MAGISSRPVRGLRFLSGPRLYIGVSLAILVAAGSWLLAGLTGCGASIALSPSPPVPESTVSPVAGSPIQHIVVIMQENRSFDNLFNGFPGADTAQSGMSGG